MPGRARQVDTLGSVKTLNMKRDDEINNNKWVSVGTRPRYEIRRAKNRVSMSW